MVCTKSWTNSKANSFLSQINFGMDSRCAKVDFLCIEYSCLPFLSNCIFCRGSGFGSRADTWRVACVVVVCMMCTQQEQNGPGSHTSRLSSLMMRCSWANKNALSSETEMQFFGENIHTLEWASRQATTRGVFKQCQKVCGVIWNCIMRELYAHGLTPRGALRYQCCLWVSRAKWSHDRWAFGIL